MNFNNFLSKINLQSKLKPVIYFALGYPIIKNLFLKSIDFKHKIIYI